MVVAPWFSFLPSGGAPRRFVLTLLALALRVVLPAQGTLVVTFFDVGQADSILIQQGDHNLLIDAGNNADQKFLLGQLDARHVTSFDAVIGTHVHEDHIGSMDAVIRSRDVAKVYFPHQTATTKTFRDFVAAVKSKNLKLTVPHPGDRFDLGEAHLEVLAPARDDYPDQNDYSIVVRLSFGKVVFLLTGDANFESESEMLASGRDLGATVLKVGHHGSRTSSGADFLAKVHPQFAVISVGTDNKYGHPAPEALERLKAAGATVFRTDRNSTIAAKTDGSTLSWTMDR